MPLFDRPIFLAHLLIVLLCTPSSSGSFQMSSLLFQRRPHSSLELVKEFFNRTLLPSCDLTANSCDIDCCNDMDCSEEEIRSFECSEDVDPMTADPIFADPFYCNGNSTSYLTSVDPVLCYEIENSPYLGRYFLEEKIMSKKQLESRLEEMSIGGLKIFTDPPPPVVTDRKPYRYGSPLRYSGDVVVTIPTSVLGKGSCSSQAVRYLLDVDDVCVSYADSESCETNGRFRLDTYLSGSGDEIWLADFDSGDSQKTVDSTVSIYCGLVDRPLSGYVECNDLTQLMKTRYDRVTNTCENVVTQLRFDLTWFENRLTLANVTILLSTVSLEKIQTSVPSRRLRTRPTVRQRFQVKFHRHDSHQTRPAERRNSYRLYDRLNLHHVQ